AALQDRELEVARGAGAPAGRRPRPPGSAGRGRTSVGRGRAHLGAYRGPLPADLRGGRVMRVLVLSSTFPNAQQPTRGVFVPHRIRRLAKRCEIVVVAPLPWFPLNRWLRAVRGPVSLAAAQVVLPL